MTGPVLELAAANAVFVATHFAMSHPLRAPMVARLGPTGFQLAYTLVSAAALAWVYFAFIAAPPGDLPGSGDWGWVLATALTAPAMILFAGSMAGNPALPTPKAEAQAMAMPQGVLHITRHPMMWGIALWAASHIVLWTSWRTTITAASMGLLALIGAHLQDRKKRELMGEAWATWESRTSYWPQIGGFAHAGAVPWILGLALFAGLSWLHAPLAGIQAGIWRWLPIG